MVWSTKLTVILHNIKDRGVNADDHQNFDKGIIFLYKEKTHFVTYLSTDRVKHQRVNSSNIKMKDSEEKWLKTSNQFCKLSRSSLSKNSKICMSLN